MGDSNQHAYWNGPAGERWASHQATIDRSLAAITKLWLASVEPTGRILDVGCGGGTTTRLLHAKASYVLGVDIAAPMIAVARAGGGEFILADAAAHAFEPFDLIASRFGVMFFEDPVAAFVNLKKASARLAFVCWRSPRENPWAMVPLQAAGDLVPPSPPFDPTAPGPFAFADATRVRDILARAGFANVKLDAHASTMRLGDTLDDAVAQTLAVGPLARAAGELGPDARAEIAERVRGAIATEMAASVWIVTA